jgi:uncharacterized membrane protein
MADPEILAPEQEEAESPGRVTHVLRRVEIKIGPLPPPEELLKYNQVFDGCAERIVAMAEHQAEHRQDLERTVVKSNAKAQLRGQIFAFILSGLIIVTGAYLVLQNRNIAGFTLIGGDAATLIGMFIYGRRTQQGERQEKRGEMPKPSDEGS